MSNISVKIPFVNGSLYSLVDEGESTKEAVHRLYTDDFGAPPRNLTIEIETDSGKKVRVVIPYSPKSKAAVFIDGDEI